MNLRVFRGRPLPLGTSQVASTVNFALLCQHGSEVTLVIEPLEGGPVTEVPLDARKNRTGHHWHIRLDGLPDRFKYGWRVHGPDRPRCRFDSDAVLIDPAAIMISDGATWGTIREPSPKTTIRRGVFIRGTRYDWQEDAPPLVPWEDSIIYELHVRGFTCHPSAGVAKPGTFAGLVEKIPYLKWLRGAAGGFFPGPQFGQEARPFTNPPAREKASDFLGEHKIA